MKSASAGLIALLNSNTDFIIADLWTFNLKNGINLYYTDYDINLMLGSQLYRANDVLVTGGNMKQTRGLQVNETDVTCYPDLGAPVGSPSLVGTIPFLQAVSDRMFNRASVTRQRVFMPTPGDTSLGAIILYQGEVSDITASRNEANIKAKDETNLLNIYMPRRQYQPTCAWVFGDSNCGFNRSSIAVNSSVNNAVSGSNINCALTNVAGFFNNGTIRFTSGANNGLSMSIKNWVPNVATLVAPFPNVPAVGDTFTITPGCTKTFAAPTQDFNAACLAGSSSTVLDLPLSNAAGYFNGATILCTSGVNVGQSRVISLWVPGQASLSSSFGNTPTAGDTFTLTAVIGNTQNTCTGYFGAAAAEHFGGDPYVPIPETAY